MCLAEHLAHYLLNAFLHAVLHEELLQFVIEFVGEIVHIIRPKHNKRFTFSVITLAIVPNAKT